MTYRPQPVTAMRRTGVTKVPVETQQLPREHRCRKACCGATESAFRTSLPRTERAHRISASSRPGGGTERPFGVRPRDRIEACLCQEVVSGRVEEARGVAGVGLVVGPGSDCSEAPVFRVSAGHAGLKSRPWLSFRARLLSVFGRRGVGGRRRR